MNKIEEKNAENEKKNEMNKMDKKI